MSVLCTTQNLSELLEVKKKLMSQRYHTAVTLNKTDRILYTRCQNHMPIDSKIAMIDELISSKTEWFREIQVHLHPNLCGYKKTLDLIKYDQFLGYQEIWNLPDHQSEEMFMTSYNCKACSKWDNMTQEGSSSQKTHNDNASALWRLQYPKHFIIYTIEIGCINGLECVWYTMALCEWMSQKIKGINAS
jgi:hypothetical protein